VNVNGTNYKFAVKSYEDSSINEDIPIFYQYLAEIDHVDFFISPIGLVAEPVQQMVADNKKLLLGVTSTYFPNAGYNTSYTITFFTEG